MEAISLSKRNLFALLSGSAILTLVIGWFIGVFLFEDSQESREARNYNESVEFFNTQMLEFTEELLQDDLFASAQAKLGGELSESILSKESSVVQYTNKRLGFSLSLPTRVLITTEVPNNPGIPLLVYELDPSTVVIGKAATQLDPLSIIADGDTSYLPIFTESTATDLEKDGMRISFLPAPKPELESVLRTTFPNCSVSKATVISGGETGIDTIEINYTPAENCDLAFQPFIRYITEKQTLVLANDIQGCWFKPPASSDFIIEECLDSEILESLSISR